MKLRIVSYNIHRAIGVDRKFRPERIEEILEKHDPHVVMLQEVDDGVPRSRHLDLARQLADRLGYEHYAVGHNVSLRKGRYGNAVLSRFPILAERNIDLTIGARKRRGCQYVTIDVVGDECTDINIFNFHLGLSARERRQQVGLLASAPEFLGMEPGAPCLLGGDTNDWRSLLRPVFTDVFGFRCATDHRTRRGVRGIRTYPSFSPRGPLDRIYYRGPLRLLRAHACRHHAATVASDHLPVIADFELV